MKRIPANVAETIEARRKDLQEEMQRALSKLQDCPYFSLDDYVLPESSAEDAHPRPEAKAWRKLWRCDSGPLYVSRCVAPGLPPARTIQIQTYNRVVH